MDRLFINCKGCNKKSFLGHDYCLRNTKNTMFACCGHGDIEKAYLINEQGERFEGYEVFIFALMNKSKLIDIVKIYIDDFIIKYRARRFKYLSYFIMKLNWRYFELNPEMEDGRISTKTKHFIVIGNKEWNITIF